MKIGLQFDLRNPPEWRRPSEQLYAECLEMVEWADSRGFEFVDLPEHHFTAVGSPGTELEFAL